jgi:Predicted membrane protein (DUF2339)
MEEFGLYLCCGILIFIFINLRNRFNKIDSNLSVLNKKIDQLKNQEFVAEKIIPIAKEEYKPAIPIIPIVEVAKELIPKIESIKPEIASSTIIPIFKEEEIVKKEVEKVAFSADAVATPKPIVERKPYVPKPTFYEKFKENNPDLEKFIGENLINKIGILILVLGISYFVKYSIDQGWIPTPARVGIGMLAGAMVLGVAHKLRKLYAAFSSVFVAGAIAIFYFTIGIAFHDYKLFGQEVAFGIMVLITAFAALITVSYNRLELGVLTLIGGFAVPFMVSTGSGNYIVLFSYILILNTGILAIAYNKKWNLLNILAYIFSWVLYLGWLNTEINEEKIPHYLGALLFAFAFYFMFTIINIINNIRNKGEFSKTQLMLLTANTFVFFGVGMAILNNYHPEFKGIFTTLVGVLNLVYAWFLYKKFGINKSAVYLLIGLTLTFVTLAIPIQFSGHYITLFWAAEAVLLLWLSQKSSISSYKYFAIIVQVLMFGSLILDWEHFYAGDSILQIVINPIFITGIVAIASCFATYYLLKKETESLFKFGITFNPEIYRRFIFVTGIVLSYFVGILEVSFQSFDYLEYTGSAIVFPVVYHLLFTAVLCFFLLKKNTETSNQITTLLAVVNIILFTFVFSHYAFKEHSNYVKTGIYQNLALKMHYVMLVLTIYFGYLLFKLNKKNQLIEVLKKPIFTWIIAFFIIYIASTEVMLHGLILKDSQVTMQEILKSNPAISKDIYSIQNEKNYLADLKIENSRETILKTSYPILWGILAFLFLIYGIKKPSKTLRIIALSLLGLTIAKLFIYDISNVSETGKIIAFILLGVLILIISFVYQKLKVLVADDVKPKINSINFNKEENSIPDNDDENI